MLHFLEAGNIALVNRDTYNVITTRNDLIYDLWQSPVPKTELARNVPCAHGIKVIILFPLLMGLSVF